MGFGSYDESEQEKNEIEAEAVEQDEDKLKEESEHEGSVEFKMEDTESAIERLSEIKQKEEEENE